MKKILTLFAAIVCGIALNAKTLYLSPSANWQKDGARFAIYTFGAGEQWYSMTPVSAAGGLYQADVDDKYPNVIFCRMNGNTTENNWDNKWNQTRDMAVDANHNLCVIEADSWDGGGSWSTYSEGGCLDGPYGLKINGSQIVEAPLFGDPDQQGRVQYKAECVDLQEGDEIQLANLSCEDLWMVDIDQYGAFENFTGGKQANKLTCNVPGTYDFYIKLSDKVGDLVYIEVGKYCHGETPYAGSVPEKCPDVLLQAFYWDSYQKETDEDSKTAVYGRTKWIDFINKKGSDGVQSVAEEMGQWFDMIWLPPMSKGSGGTGYLPTYYHDLNSDWGTFRRLSELINTFHTNGARVIADIVVNHIYPESGWCKIAKQNFGRFGVFEPTTAWICNTDEMNWDTKKAEAGACWGKATGNPDDGYGSEANYEPARDWDHSNPDVQAMVKAYLNWLRDSIQIDGFRYDYCKGFNNWHIGDYNAAAKAYFSVMEMWDGNPATLQYHLNEANWNTSTFDFATKYTAFNDGIAADNYGALKGAGLPGAGKARWAVTFLDSHDSFLRDDNEFCGSGKSMTICKEKVPQCYAFLLSMPGVPLVFWPHWVTFKEEIKALINARYKTGVHSESAVQDEGGDGYYKATITGTNGEIRLLLGPNSGYQNTPQGFTLAAKGVNYGVYIKMINNRGDKNKERQPLPTTVEKVQNEKVQGVKFLENGKLFIRMNDKVYDVMGRPVK